MSPAESTEAVKLSLMESKTLLFGATGGIGSQVCTRLLDRGYRVTAFVRSSSRLPEPCKGHPLLTVVEDPRGHLALCGREFKELVDGHDTVVQCLGHNLSFSGMFLPPRRLCRDTVRKICGSLNGPNQQIKLIVINTEGVDRPDGGDGSVRGCCEKVILGCLKCCIPPHADNVATLSCLDDLASSNPNISFCAVRPSDLVDKEPSKYEVHETLQNGIFNAGETSRSNVGEFMASLVADETLWSKW
eukprot:CAMPEP_0118640542 /NCGR_PEP_ID=MMETSP0785-20121206/4809_1 /TAXON_ID=91992 /ORGANISM="Bolidomonas pacifica, Strain CCMP 1866" /LENGTH=244 /DNA_ID=CAMNT_0006531937 /DNA_START=171 /DNA_END=902 /DNA_ORIENTATION=-